MNVLLTLYTTAWGGAEESILNLAEELTANKINTTLLWISSYTPSNQIQFPPNVRIIRLKVLPQVYYYLAPILIIFLCLFYRIHIVNLNWRFVNQETKYLKLFHIKSVATIRAIFFDKQSSADFDSADAVIGVSQAVVDQVKKLGYKKPCYVIYNGIKQDNLGDFNPKNFKPEKLMSMSRLVGWKRIDWSIKAVVQLHRQGLPLTLDIFGEGREAANLKRLIIHLNATKYIHLKGYLPHFDSSLSDYGIFLAPSFKEPFGKTIVENVLQGRVIVSSKSGGIPEILPNYPLLFQFDSFPDYIIKIKSAYTNFSLYQGEIQKLKNKNFITAYSMSRVVKDYMKVYNKL